jgi:WD40 repeat protein
VHGPIRNNAEFVSENTLVHPVGHHVALYHVEDREMQFLQKNRNVRGVLALSVAPKRHVIAVCEALSAENSDVAQVSIFHVGTRNRMRTMTIPSQGVFTSCCFTQDSKYLVTQGGAPDFNLVYWKWEQEKMMARESTGQEVNRVRCSTFDINQITTSGPNHLRLWTLENQKLKSTPLLSGAKEQEKFSDHVWIAGGKMLACTEQGMVMVFEASETAVELKHTLQVPTPYQGCKIQTIAAYTKGFLVAGTMGFLGVYEKTEDLKDPFLLIKTFSASEESLDSLAVSPTDETVVVYTKSNQLLTFPLGSIDIMSEEEDHFSNLVPKGVHIGGVVAMDTCRQKPLLFTVSSDKTARVWHYLKWRCELVQKLSEEPTSVACHPSGFQVLIGFKERVRLYNVLIDSLRPFKDMPLKHCKEVRFTHGGHRFACAIGISVMVFSTHSFEVLHNFTGHIGPVKRLVWSRDDRFLYSAGADGGVYGWNLRTGSRLEDTQHVVKQCQYNGLVIDSPDRNGDPTGPIVVCGSDFKIRQISGGDEKKVFDTGDCCLTQLVLSNSNKFLFAGTAKGAVRIYEWPLTEAYHEFQVHTGPVNALRISADDKYLFSASEDGSIFVLLVQPIENGNEIQVAPPDRRQFNLDAVLVSQEEVEERETMLADMRMKFEQMKSDTEYNLHRKDTEWGEKLKTTKEEAEIQLSAERARYEELQHRHEQYVRDHMEQTDKRDADHVQVTQELENQYEHKLATELERYDRLAEDMEAMRQRCEGLLEAQDSRHARLAAEERHQAEQHQLAQAEKIRQLHEDLKYNEVKFEEVLAQQETEYEKELKEVKQHAEQELAEERQNTAIKQGGLTAMKNKYDALKKKLNEAKIHLGETEQLYAQQKAKSKKLEETLKHFEAHMEEREATLAEKERMILSLRSTNRTLDNFRFVLDHRLQQLTEEKGPITQHIEQLEKHIRDMYDELVGEYHNKKQIDSLLEQKDLKIGTLTKELVMLRAYGRERDRTIASFNRELTSIVGLTTPKDIEDAVKDLYRQYVKGEKPRQKTRGNKSRGNASKDKAPKKAKGKEDGDEEFDEESDEDDEGGGDNLVSEDSGEAVREARRQRDYMQKTVVTLKRALKQAKGEAATKSKAAMSENSLLISECNHLRKEGRQLRVRGIHSFTRSYLLLISALFLR